MPTLFQQDSGHIPAELLERLVSTIGDTFPRAQTFVCSAKDGTSLDAWFEAVLAAEGRDSQPLKIDYDLYAEGEALLGWLNCTVQLESDAPFDGNQTLVDLAGAFATASRSRIGRSPISR